MGFSGFTVSLKLVKTNRKRLLPVARQQKSYNNKWIQDIYVLWRWCHDTSTATGYSHLQLVNVKVAIRLVISGVYILSIRAF